MPRVARFVVPDCPHHITQRGNFRQQVFFRDEDHRLYLDLLTEYAPKHGLSIQAFCLMPNHVHLIATPQNELALPRTLQRVHSDYSRYINLRLRRGGHLWQARYYSVAMDNQHFWAALAYVEQNPSRAGLVDHALNWRWSSAPLRTDEGPCHPLLDQQQWRQNHTTKTWQSCLESSLSEDPLFERIREATESGWPLGNEDFLEVLSARLGVPVRKRKPGRPQIGTQIGQIGTTTSNPEFPANL